MQGSVAKSTHAGLPWLPRIRNEVGDKVHVWPFDGWDVPDGKSVIANLPHRSSAIAIRKMIASPTSRTHTVWLDG